MSNAGFLFTLVYAGMSGVALDLNALESPTTDILLDATDPINRKRATLSLIKFSIFLKPSSATIRIKQLLSAIVDRFTT